MVQRVTGNNSATLGWLILAASSYRTGVGHQHVSIFWYVDDIILMLVKLMVRLWLMSSIAGQFQEAKEPYGCSRNQGPVGKSSLHRPLAALPSRHSLCQALNNAFAMESLMA